MSWRAAKVDSPGRIDEKGDSWRVSTGAKITLREWTGALEGGAWRRRIRKRCSSS
jgi:hypothetical protein